MLVWNDHVGADGRAADVLHSLRRGRVSIRRKAGAERERLRCHLCRDLPVRTARDRSADLVIVEMVADGSVTAGTHI